MCLGLRDYSQISDTKKQPVSREPKKGTEDGGFTYIGNEKWMDLENGAVYDTHGNKVNKKKKHRIRDALAQLLCFNSWEEM